MECGVRVTATMCQAQKQDTPCDFDKHLFFILISVFLSVLLMLCFVIVCSGIVPCAAFLTKSFRNECPLPLATFKDGMTLIEIHIINI